MAAGGDERSIRDRALSNARGTRTISHSSGSRHRRGAEIIREAISGAIARDLADPRLGFVTITDVSASPDFAAARVFVTTLQESQRERSLAALESARGVLQRRVADALKTRNTPHLEFVYDDLQDRARRIDELLDQAAPSDQKPAGGHDE
ncbi:MAG: 30S ribosome-binding factor RbfA [Actinobacteria bacterium]|nr:30S ribosome-binding factor RbfA [Thermoleophilia bacterium]MCB9010963.1 30S ribosome-binding factor RbfA [Actinomycetota bacterium]